MSKKGQEVGPVNGELWSAALSDGIDLMEGRAIDNNALVDASLRRACSATGIKLGRVVAHVYEGARLTASEERALADHYGVEPEEIGFS